ncbi:PLP-dependent aminotransferase family protein [Nocardia nepalensis]|uniref:aminotransferase-like domain-containing protein n=1 Tax=Nocardia nepalensis TaxID=3375448 RepID=UPI003B682A2A
MSSYREVAAQIAAQIRAGRWSPGERLPTHRALAAECGIAVATATRVFTELQRLGLAVGEPGRGTFVRDRSIRLVPAEYGPGPDTVSADLSVTQPMSPRRAELLRGALRDLAGAGDLDALLRQQPPGGRPRDREVAAAFLAQRGIDADPDRIFLTGGVQHGLDLIVRSVLAPGDVVAVDALTYPGFKMLAQAHRVELAPVPVSPTGPDLAALAELCRRRRVRAVYSMPTLHNPLGWVLDDAAREHLVAIARTHDLLLIEDASYAFLAAPAPAPLVSRAPERTYWLSSLSKSVAAGLRFGMLVAPPSGRNVLKYAVRVAMASPPGLVAAVATRWLADGTVTALEAASRRAAEQQQRVLRGELAGLDVIAHPRSYFAWLSVDPLQRMDRVAAELSRRGVRVSTADIFATTAHVPHGLRIAVGSPAPADLPDALAAVRSAIDAVPLG